MSRAPFDSKYCAVGLALFESSAPLGRVLDPAYRHLLRARRDVVMGCGDPDRATPTVGAGCDSGRARRTWIPSRGP